MLRFTAPSMKAAAGSLWQARNPGSGRPRKDRLKNRSDKILNALFLRADDFCSPPSGGGAHSLVDGCIWRVSAVALVHNPRGFTAYLTHVEHA